MLQKINPVHVNNVLRHSLVHGIFISIWKYILERNHTAARSVQRQLPIHLTWRITWEFTLVRNHSAARIVQSHLLSQVAYRNIYGFTLVKNPTVALYVFKVICSFWYPAKSFKVHTCEKPHSCSFCAKSFSKLLNLREHLKFHNKETSSSAPFVQGDLKVHTFEELLNLSHIQRHPE